MTALVSARAVAVGRGPAPCLTGVDLDVAPGERVALVGGNGAGKTSLLRVLAGLDPARAGVVRWRGGALPRGAARPRAIGVVLQAEIAGPLTVAEVLALAGGAAPVDDPELAPLARRPCATLSGGELQRVALARARAADPSLYLLDEPTNHLDPRCRAALLAWLDALPARTAVVVATHDLDLAARLGRVVVLGDGAVLADGAARDVMTSAVLGRALGATVRRLDVAGEPPWFRVGGPA